MIINANFDDGYSFYIESDDVNHMPKMLLNLLIPTNSGMKFKRIENIPSELKLGERILDLIPITKTRIVTNKNKFIHDSGFCIDINYFDLRAIVLLRRINPLFRYNINSNGQFESNQIPQLHNSFDFGTIQAINGQYNWQKKEFRGRVYVG